MAFQVMSEGCLSMRRLLPPGARATRSRVTSRWPRNLARASNKWLEAVSQNLMHADLNVTDGVCGIVPGIDVKRRIGQLGNGGPEGLDKAALPFQLKELLKQLEEATQSSGSSTLNRGGD